MSTLLATNIFAVRKNKFAYRSDDVLHWKKPEFTVLKPNVPNIKEEKATWISEKILLNVGEKIFILDRHLVSIKEVILSSENLLKLEDDWDDEGAIATNTLTYGRAIELLINYSRNLLSTYNSIIAVPEINITKDGSIDLEWRTENHILLMNIQNTEDFIVHYYGEDYKSKTIIKGFIESHAINSDLAFWMQKLV